MFRGAGWNVIKVVWGSYWDPLLARDTNGILRKLMMETVDGEYQNCKAFGGAYTREHFFGKYPETREMVANLSDDDIWRLNRGGHDPHKVYAAYHAAVNTKGMPTVILAKTVKGYGMGAAGESQNPTHQQKKLDNEAVRAFRDRFRIPIADDKVDDVPYYHPGKDSPEVQYMLERRKALGGFLPQRRAKSASIAVPDLSAFEQIIKGTGDREISTTMAFVRGMNLLLRDKQVAPRIVPIVADEARTFGMEGMFRQIGIYAPFGQKYKPVDADQLMYYREDQKGQVLQEGITEPGAMSRVDGGGDELFDQRRADAAVLHLLLDVRLPAHRRSRLGRGRHARARIPRRRHRRPHDVERRRPAARGRPLAPDGRRDPELPRLRSDVLVRGRGDPAGRRRAACCRSRKTSTTTSP